MISERILATFIGFGIGVLLYFVIFGIGILLYLVINECVNEYRWWKIKRHLIEAIEALNLWDVVNEPVITLGMFKQLTTYLDAHKYKHCFHEHGGALLLTMALSEIRAKREKENN